MEKTSRKGQITEIIQECITKGMTTTDTLEELKKKFPLKKEGNLRSRIWSYTNHTKRKEVKTEAMQATIQKIQAAPTLSALIPKKDDYKERRIKEHSDIIVLQKAFEKRFNVLLVGDTGSGKTHAVRYLAATLKIPYMRVNLNGATTPEDLVGQWVPDNQGGYKWQDGVLTTMMRNGGVFCADEINSCPADILFVLNSLLDDEKRIVLTQKDGEVVKAHEGFFFVATMNPDYEGTKPLNAALKDRFHIILNYDYQPSIERRLGIADVEGLPELAQKLRDMYEKQEIVTPISTRMLLQLKDNMQVFGKETAVLMFVNKFALEEKQAVETAAEMHLLKGGQ